MAMSIVMYVMLGSGAALLGSVLIFRAESVSGKRFFLRGVRGRLDSHLDSNASLFFRIKRLFGTSSLRLLLHYVLHQVLSLVLVVVSFVEARLHRLRMKNKVVAKVIRSKSADSHLSRLTRHKEVVSQR